MRKLEFSKCIASQDDGMLIKIIGATPDLDALIINKCTWIALANPDSFHPIVSPRAFITISELELPLQPWTTAISFQSLTNLEFMIITDKDTASWQGVLDSAPLLANIWIRKLEHRPKSLDLRNQSVLEVLRIQAPYFTPGDDGQLDPTIPSCTLLSSAHTTKLSCVEIMFESSSQAGIFRHVNWANVKRVMENPAVTWSNAPKLMFTIKMHADWSGGAQANIMAGLKRDSDKVGADWLHVNIQAPRQR
jgi:hypothetical protein